VLGTLADRVRFGCLTPESRDLLEFPEQFEKKKTLQNLEGSTAASHVLLRQVLSEVKALTQFQPPLTVTRLHT
jgi:hypothetical protein